MLHAVAATLLLSGVAWAGPEHRLEVTVGDDAVHVEATAPLAAFGDAHDEDAVLDQFLDALVVHDDAGNRAAPRGGHATVPPGEDHATIEVDLTWARPPDRQLLTYDLIDDDGVELVLHRGAQRVDLTLTPRDRGRAIRLDAPPPVMRGSRPGPGWLGIVGTAALGVLLVVVLVGLRIVRRG